MKKIFHLSNCETYRRILKELNLSDAFVIQDIKKNPLSILDIEELYELSGSYEALFNKRSRLCNNLGLKDKNLKEPDYKKLLLKHYTFLKRPALINNKELFIGNSKKTIRAAKESLL